MRSILTDLGRPFTLPFLLAAALLAGCDEGSSGDTPPADSLVATTLTAHSDTLLAAMVDSAVAEPPSVLVRDQNGEALAGVTVDFTITAGGGQLTGAHPVTDTLGIAAVDAWHLGATPGINTVTATVGALAPVTFTATAAPRPVSCTTFDTLPFNAPVPGDLQAGTCSSDNGSYIDLYQVDMGLAYAYKVRLLSSAFDPFAIAYDTLHRQIGFNDDSLSGIVQNSIFTLLVPQGRYFVGASSYNPSDTGAYTLSVIPATDQNEYCTRFFTIPGVHTNQSILDSDCHQASGRLWGDLFWIRLDSAQSITVFDTSASFDALVALYDGATLQLLAQNDDASAGTLNSRLPFTAPATGYYVLFATTATDTTKGYYSLTLAPGIVAGAPHPYAAPVDVKPTAALPTRLTVGRRR